MTLETHHANIRLGQKCLEVGNTLAYYNKALQSLSDSTLALPANVRHGWKWLAATRRVLHIPVTTVNDVKV